MPVPNNVFQAMNDAKATWERLTITVPQNKAQWTQEQLRALGIHAELAKHTYNALSRLVDYLNT